MSESPPEREPRLKSVPAGRAPGARESPDALLRRIEWTVIRRLDGLLQGDYRTLFRAFGLDLADLREYQFHDDVRHIDWNVTARLQIPHVREFNADREVTAWFLLDTSGSVDFGSRDKRKRAQSAALAAALGRLLTRHGNRVGAIIYTDRVDAVIPARGGRRHVLHLLDRMLGAAAPERGRETDLAELLETAQSVIKRRSVVFLVSDFIGAPGWSRGLALLARRHEVVAVRLYDPLEMALPDLGLVLMRDAETGEQLFVDTHDARFRRRFADAAARRESALRSALGEAGVDCLELATDDDLVDALMRFTVLRKRRSQLAAGVSLHGRPRES
ncbi:MAG: DUF58 domain-containing protein [Burkholderiales bacterium]|nr:DUF58 domain-containing protein [Burkholderiales bacterium]